VSGLTKNLGLVGTDCEVGGENLLLKEAAELECGVVVHMCGTS
jgi:hypothetical protein